MRLNKFESARAEALGEGEDKRVFIDPENQDRIISEMRAEKEKETPRQLKGRYYLTKIAHLLLPQNIPDVYQAGESSGGKQTIDAGRVSHSEGHALLQALRRSGENIEPARKKIIEEMMPGIEELDSKLINIGFGFNIDPNVGNYTSDEQGNVHYLETFEPWRVDDLDPKKLELLFGEEELKSAIEGISDKETKEKCVGYLERLLALFEEEKIENQTFKEQRERGLPDSRPGVEKFEAEIAPFLEEQLLANLHALKTMKEALDSQERASAVKVRNSLFNQLTLLRNETNLTTQEYLSLFQKYIVLDRAVGTINSGMVDHDR